MIKSLSNLDGYYRSRQDILIKTSIFIISLCIYYLSISSAFYFVTEKLSHLEIINESDYHFNINDFYYNYIISICFKSKRITYKNLNVFFAILELLFHYFEVLRFILACI